jgi:class 3 adenylate cyclase
VKHVQAATGHQTSSPYGSSDSGRRSIIVRRRRPGHGRIPPPGIQFQAVSVFADIRNSTAITNLIGPLQMAALIGELFTGATAQIEGEGGHIADLNGDGGLALFGGPDAADHGLRAAIRIQDFAARIILPAMRAAASSAQPSGLYVGIGIDRGNVCRAVIPTSRGIQESWSGSNTAAKLASLGSARRAIALTQEAFTTMTEFRATITGVATSEVTVRIGNADRVIRTLSLADVRSSRSPGGSAVPSRPPE